MTSNSTIESTPEVGKKVRDVYTVLDKSELDLLSKRISGYGWLSDSARKAGVHPNTIRKVLIRGYGYPDIINKIRNIL